jgi:hypothetical protein
MLARQVQGSFRLPSNLQDQNQIKENQVYATVA